MDALRRQITALATALATPATLQSQHDHLETTTQPEPGRAHLQHDAMVKLGLCKEAVQRENRNRYCNQFPFDSSLVRVPQLDYINASWISLPPLGDRNFIISQGPLHPNSFSSGNKSDYGQSSVPDTCKDFVQMLWALDVKTVVMLCKIEPGYQGCSPYFSEKKGGIHMAGEINVVTDKVEQHDGFVVRTLTMNKDGETKQVQHFHFTQWPNYGVPEGPGPLASYVWAVYSHLEKQEAASKTVVHCSGGLGRSGSFVTIYTMLKMYSDIVKSKKTLTKEQEEVLTLGQKIGGASVVPFILKMREQRHPWMVEGMGQFTIVHQTIVKLLQKLEKEN